MRIWFLADMHLGHMGCHKKLLSKIVKMIADTDPTRNRVFLEGDLLDAIAVTDKRFALSSLDDEIRNRGRDSIVNQQSDMAIGILSPLRGYIDAMLIGNHEQKIVKSSSDPLDAVCKEIGGNYEGAICAYIRYKVPAIAPKNGRGHGHSWTVDCQIHHGAGGGSQSGSKIIRIERRADHWPTATIISSGHTHKKFITSTSRMYASTGEVLNIKEKVQHCFSVGSFLRGYHDEIKGVSYIEQGDYNPTDLGGLYADIEFSHEDGNRVPYIHWGNV